MIQFNAHDHAVVVTIGAMVLVFDREVFLAAVKRGKARRRQERQRAREGEMATRAARKRSQL